jgi:hypothetical protein
MAGKEVVDREEFGVAELQIPSQILFSPPSYHSRG